MKHGEEGNLRPRRSAAAGGAREGPSLSVYSTRTVQRCRPTAIAANDGRIRASPASGVSMGRWLSVSLFGGVLAAALFRLRKDCGGLQLS